MKKETRDLYHLTTKENLESILKNGLECTIGENSSVALETKHSIYLCDYEDILYWSIILGKDVVVEIPREVIDLGSIQYNSYYNFAEYSYTKNIDAKYITHVELPEYDQKYMDLLCYEYIHILNSICTHLAIIFTEDYKYFGKEDLLKSTVEELSIFLHVCKNLDYKSVDQDRLKNYIERLGVEDCAFTFCDIYNNTDKRLWEQLIEYDCEDEMKVTLRKVYDYIKINLEGCNQVKTGGWC